MIDTIGVWDSTEEIEWEKLPERFVLKCTHDSGSISICKDKRTFNREEAISKLNAGLKTDYYRHTREWPYKNVPRKIIAEKFIENEGTGDLPDYKFFCFDGEVKAMFIATDRNVKGKETKFDFFDAEFNHLPFTWGHPNAETMPQKPQCFDLMKDLAQKLSKGIPQARVDFYEANGKVYFGEITLFHWSGLVPIEPKCWDKIFGDWIILPQKTL